MKHNSKTNTAFTPIITNMINKSKASHNNEMALRLLKLKQHRIYLGFHLSTEGSILNPLKLASSLGYTAVQLFLFNPRSWVGKEVSDDTIAEFSSMLKSTGIKANAHIPYLCNPSSPNDDVYKKSRSMLIQNANLSGALGIPLVIHAGSHLGKGFPYAFDRIVELLGYVLDSTSAQILVENSAGYNNSVGSTLSELASILTPLSSAKLGLCLDTAHAFAAGYDIATKEGVQSFINEIDSTLKINSIRLIHLNDSKYGLNSGLDRHWHIGKGFIGNKGFINLFSSKYFSEGTFVMETPADSEEDEIQNMHAALDIFDKAIKNRLKR